MQGKYCLILYKSFLLYSSWDHTKWDPFKFSLEWKKKCLVRITTNEVFLYRNEYLVSHNGLRNEMCNALEFWIFILIIRKKGLYYICITLLYAPSRTTLSEQFFFLMLLTNVLMIMDIVAILWTVCAFTGTFSWILSKKLRLISGRFC